LGAAVHPLYALPFALLFFFVLYFFRDPFRQVTADDTVLYSSADGKVVRIGEAEHEFMPERKGQRVLIFMSPLDVHRNRAPLNARVREVFYKKGQFLPAFQDGMEFVNERASVVFEVSDAAGPGVVVVTQIAGILARRIVCRAQIGKDYLQGEQFGLIRFGSANEMLFDHNWQIVVQEGDRVRAGLTVIARRKV
jgi:phosphatidylserine decarboxylase